jgi:solute carrier family 25 phosphate transporter 23/24/25/41
MRVSDVVSELEVKMEEPQNQRDQRVEELWRKLDPAGHGELDLKGLQKGLRRIDHRKISFLAGTGDTELILPTQL